MPLATACVDDLLPNNRAASGEDLDNDYRPYEPCNTTSLIFRPGTDSGAALYVTVTQALYENG